MKNPVRTWVLVGVVCSALFAGLFAYGFAVGFIREYRRLSEEQRSDKWTPTWIAKVEEHSAIGFAKRSTLAPDDRARVARCVAAKVVEAIPGGPELFTKDRARAEALSREATAACVEEIAFSQAEWVSAFQPLFTTGCVNEHGEPFRDYCRCLAEQAPRHFASPASFRRVEQGLDEASPAERERVDAMIDTCQKHMPE